MDTVTLLKKVRKLEIKTKAITKNLLAGDYHSAFKGRGMSFSEVRAYSYGDDIRDIDWNVTAKTSVAHVKIYEEERELTFMLIIDMSASSRFGSSHKYKNEVILEIAALLAFSAMGNQDKVGAVFFTDTVEKYIPPKKGKQNILHIIREMIHFQPSGKGTRIDVVLDFLNNIQKKKSVCFLISDFRGGDYTKALTVTGKKHDLIGLYIYDERERELPDAGLVRVVDPETGLSVLLDTSSQQVRMKYKKMAEDHVAAVQQTFAMAGNDLVHVSTVDDYVKILHGFFKKRAGKR